MRLQRAEEAHQRKEGGVYSHCGQEEDGDGKEQGAEEELIHVVRVRVGSLSEYVPPFAWCQSLLPRPVARGATYRGIGSIDLPGRISATDRECCPGRGIVGGVG